MATEIKLIVETIVNGKTQTKDTIAQHKITKPNKLDDIGLSQADQLCILQQVQEIFLTLQTPIINNIKYCPNCGMELQKNGKEVSDFHAIYSDHKLSIQRFICKDCNWKSTNSLHSLFGSSIHPSLLKLQGLLGAEYSYNKCEEILQQLAGNDRSINNHQRIKKSTNLIGETIHELNLVEPRVKKSTTELIVVVDGGHIKDKNPDKRSFEAIAITAYQLNKIIAKDKHHNKITDKDSMVSAKNDKLKTAKNFAINVAKLQGMNLNTHVTAITDGAKNCWSVISALNGQCGSITTILDWFHIGKKFKNVEQVLPESMHESLNSAKWKLWHGKAQDSLSKLENIHEISDINAKLKINGLIKYIQSNIKHIINYEKRHTSGLAISSQVAESSIENIINSRHSHNLKMQWTREGAHNVLQIRALKLNDKFEAYWPNIITNMLKKVA
jgi:transposase-like protein